MENKTGKYFKYAIGEIILVVIGILIALQINNWSESKKQQKLEQTYYCLLLDDIEQDKQQLEVLKTLVNERIGYSNKAISIIQKEKSDATELGLNLRYAIRQGPSTFKPNDGSFQDIKSSGNLGIIKDKNITKKLNIYFKNVEGYTSAIRTNFNLEFERISRFNNWFDIGLFNSTENFYKDIFTKDIRKQLKEDLPEYIPVDVKEELYSSLVMIGLNNRRRLELLILIENEITKMHSILKTKCN